MTTDAEVWNEIELELVSPPTLRERLSTVGEALLEVVEWLRELSTMIGELWDLLIDLGLALRELPHRGRRSWPKSPPAVRDLRRTENVRSLRHPAGRSGR